ncbi:MAG: alpha/beta fold hydrolase, partial [Anaerolineales bacterium]
MSNEEILQVTSKDDTSIGLSRSGTGHPLIFVHGTCADRHSWSQVSPHIEPRFSVYALDRRGRGASGDSSEYALMREVEDVIAVVEAVGEP